MRSPIPPRISLSLLLLALPSARAQTSDDFFHGGAQSYLSNNIPAALEIVTNGLQRFPDDQKLKKLYELLNQQQQQQQNQEQEDQQQDQKEDQKQDQQKQDEEKNQTKKDEDQEHKESPDKKDQQKDKPDDQSNGKPGEQKETGEPQEVAAHQMTPQEAKQLLDAQKDDEQVLLFQPQGKPKNRTKPVKDW